MMKAVTKSRIKKSVPAKTVNDYLAKVPPEERAVLEELRKAIRTAAPKAEEVISYQIPGFNYHGPLVFFAAWATHCSLYAVGKKLLKSLADELKLFYVSGTTIHFTASNPLPAGLVKKIVKARIKENELRVKNKSKK